MKPKEIESFESFKNEYHQTWLVIQMIILIFCHELLLTNRQVANIRKAFANHSSIDIKLSKTQLSKMIQSGGFLGNLLGKLAGPLMKVAMPLAKNVLAPLGLSVAMSAIDGS